MSGLADPTVEVVDRVVIARVNGEIDMSNVGDLSASLVTQIPNDALGVALDLTALRYLDSAGIQMVYDLRERLQNRGQKLRLVVPPGSVIFRTLELVDAPRAIGVVESTEAAVVALNS
jgi:anti-anti-sigma factor